jgi:hypothetical protein
MRTTLPIPTNGPFPWTKMVAGLQISVCEAFNADTDTNLETAEVAWLPDQSPESLGQLARRLLMVSAPV